MDPLGDGMLFMLASPTLRLALLRFVLTLRRRENHPGSGQITCVAVFTAYPVEPPRCSARAQERRRNPLRWGQRGPDREPRA